MAMLTQGANAPITTTSPRASVVWSGRGTSAADLDVSAFVLLAAGKVAGDAGMVFYGQPATAGVRIEALAQKTGDDYETRIVFELGALAADVDKIAVTATLPAGVAFASMPAIKITVMDGAEALAFDVPTTDMKEQALILGELYRRNGAWKFRAIGQGFVGGLEPLAKNFGVDVAAPSPAPAAPAPAAPAPAAAPSPAPASSGVPKIRLSKISLTKERSSIDLSKKAGEGFGQVRLNLNWNRGGAPKPAGGILGGLFGGGGSGRVDLDLGCLYELSNGRKGVVQALGESFGAYDGEPYIQLAADDRTGQSTDGEWIRINGARWGDVRRVLVFAFIYDGAPNWAATDGVATLHVPDQPEVEVRLTEGRRGAGMCAVALIENVGGTMRISREDRYFGGHGEMDQAYRWGLNWRAGSKD